MSIWDIEAQEVYVQSSPRLQQERADREELIALRARVAELEREAVERSEQLDRQERELEVMAAQSMEVRS